MTLLRRRMTALRRFSGQGRQGFWAIAEYAAYPAMMFIATPLYLKLLGSAQYGQWLLLLTFNGFGGVAGFGMGTVVVRDVAEQRARGDMLGAIATVRNALALTLISTSVLCLAIVATGLTVGPALLARMGSPGTITMLFLGAAGLIALEQIDNVFAGALRGLERFDWSARVEIGSKLVTIAGAIAAAWLYRRLGAVILATLALTALRALVKATVSARLLASAPLLPAWDGRRIRGMLSFGLWTWAQVIGAMLLGTVDRFLVGGMLGPSALTRYSVCLQLAQQVHAIPAAAAQILLPRISRGEGNIASIVGRAFLAIGLLATAIALPLMIFGYDILCLWVGEAIADGSTSILRVATFAYACLAFSSVAYFVMLGLGRAKLVAQLSLAGGLASLVATWGLIRYLDLTGAALSRVVYALISSVIIVELIRQLRKGRAVPLGSGRGIT